MRTQLPPELLDCIFLCLRASSDLPSLCACARVNALFASLVEPHAWHHIFIANVASPLWKRRSIGTSTTSVSAAADITSPSFSNHLMASLAFQLLTTKPHIAGLVRSLKIFVERPKPVELDSLMMRPPTRSLDDVDIARVLPLLLHLESVVLSSWSDARITWTELDDAVRKAFVRALRLPSLRKVKICEIIRFPLDVLHVSTALEQLELDGSFTFNIKSRRTEFDDLQGNLNRPNSPGLPPPRIHLKSLIVQDCSHSLPLIVSWLYPSDTVSRSSADLDLGDRLDIASLTHLEAKLRHAHDYNNISYILSACKHSLRVLVFDPGFEASFFRDDDPPAPLPLPPSMAHDLAFPRLPPRFFEAAPSEFGVPFSIDATTVISHILHLPGPFSLSSLSALEHLRLKLSIHRVQNPFTSDMVTRDGSHSVQPYMAPFEWVREVLEQFSSAPPGSQDAPTAAHSNLSLELLSLDISFSIYPETLREISWAPLSSALSDFASLVPSLKCIEMRDNTNDWNSKLATQIFQEDPHLGVLVRKGLLRILGK